MSEDLELGKIIKEAGLKEATVFVYKKDVRYIYKGNWNGKKCLLKIIPKNDPERIAKAKIEIQVSELISQNNENNQSNKVYCNIIFNSGENDSFFWIIREFFEGDSLSGTTELEKTPLGGYDLVKAEFLQDKIIIIDGIIKNLTNLQKVGHTNFSDQQFPRRFETDMSKFDFVSTGKKINVDLSSQTQKYNSLIDNYVNSTPKVCCMGDFVPSNIIVTQDKKIVFTDFEYFCIDNSSLDLAYLWLYLWRYPDWQNELLKKYPNINQDDFQISVLRILLPLFVRKFSSNDIYSQKLYMKHKWREYLIRSAGSFDFLTKT